jgi:hypothetical protein
MRILFWLLMVMSLYGGGLIGGGLVAAIINGWSPLEAKVVALGFLGLALVMQVILALRRRGVLR